MNRTAAMRADHAAGMSYAAIAAKFGTYPMAAWRACNPRAHDPAGLTKRNADIVAARRAKLSAASIALVYGISRARVYQILDRARMGV